MDDLVAAARSDVFAQVEAEARRRAADSSREDRIATLERADAVRVMWYLAERSMALQLADWCREQQKGQK
jgi:hypothetical protein